MDWHQLLRNKWMWAGAAGAAGLGLVALLRRKSTTGSTLASDTPANAGGVGSVASAYPNTSGTDIASWLGSQEGTLAAQNAEFLRQLKSTLDQLGKVPTSGAPGSPAAPVNPSTPRLPTPSGNVVTVARYTTKNPPWNSTLSGIASHYNTTVSALMKLNPTITNPNVIRTGQQIRVN